jgi:hypothetical protein
MEQAKKKKAARGRGRPSNTERELELVRAQRDTAVEFIRMLAAGSNGLPNAEEFLAEHGYETFAEYAERTREERAARKAELVEEMTKLQSELDQIS